MTTKAMLRRRVARDACGRSRPRLRADTAARGTRYARQSRAVCRSREIRQTTRRSRSPCPARTGQRLYAGGCGRQYHMQVGDDGVLLVDTGDSRHERQGSGRRPAASTDRPIRYIIDTHVHADHTGGNEASPKAGNTIAGGNVVGDIGASAGNQAAILAFQTVLDRMSGRRANKTPVRKARGPPKPTPLPSETLLQWRGNPVIHIPNAHTDGDRSFSSIART